MLGVLLLNIVEQIVVFKLMIKVQIANLSGESLFLFFLWPLLLLVELFVYWQIRKRIKERKWVWLHLVFILYTFVLVRLFYGIIGISIITYMSELWSAAFGILQKFQFYGFWAGVIISHIFFIIVIVQCFFKRKLQLSNDDNDLLSEFTV
jgi:hypothetical protein